MKSDSPFISLVPGLVVLASVLATVPLHGQEIVVNDFEAYPTSVEGYIGIDTHPEGRWGPFREPGNATVFSLSDEQAAGGSQSLKMVREEFAPTTFGVRRTGPSFADAVGRDGHQQFSLRFKVFRPGDPAPGTFGIKWYDVENRPVDDFTGDLYVTDNAVRLDRGFGEWTDFKRVPIPVGEWFTLRFDYDLAAGDHGEVRAFLNDEPLGALALDKPFHYLSDRFRIQSAPPDGSVVYFDDFELVANP
jgi:hypothetical protein